MSDNMFPTEVIELPSKGWFYPPSHPLSNGQIELYYMTAKHEDILTSPNLIRKGVVIDELLKSLIATEGVNYTDLFIGDRNAVMIAARILGYGKKYEPTVECPNCERTSEVEVNLEQLKEKDVEFKESMKGKNEFTFVLPMSKKTVLFKLLTYKDERDAQKELESLRKNLKGDVSREVTTRMRYSILAIDGERDRAELTKFIENMPARDAAALREHARQINPDIDLTFDFECPKCGHADRVEVPIDVTFFWPNARV